MFKLMKLEMKKFKLASFSFKAVIANIVILSFIFMIAYLSKVEGSQDFVDYQEVLKVIDTFIRGTFIIFGATLIAKLIIGEFKYKTITTLFMYPISRKKLITAKLAIIFLFTFTWIIISNIFVTTVYCLLSVQFELLPDTLTASLLQEHGASVLMNAIAASGMALIPLYFGMRKYSIPTTIISSILVVMIIGSTTGDFSLNDIIIVPISLALIGLTIAYLAIKNIDRIDIKA